MDETGEGAEIWIIEMIPKIIFLGIAFTVVVLLTWFFIANRIETNQLEIDLFFNRLMYSPNAISYQDPVTKRTYLGIIDLDKLNTERLESVINHPSKRTISAKITLHGKNETIYYHEKWFKNHEPLAKAGLKGFGGADYVKKEFYVTFIEEEELKSDWLRMEIIRPRT